MYCINISMFKCVNRKIMLLYFLASRDSSIDHEKISLPLSSSFSLEKLEKLLSNSELIKRKLFMKNINNLENI